MERIIVTTTEKRQVVDITEEITAIVNKQNGSSGVVSVFVSHTTAALTTADLDPGTDHDLLDAYGAMVPELDYLHPHDPSHVGDHIMASLIGPSVSIPFRDKALLLGAWQRVVLIDLNGPRDRVIWITIIPA